MSTLRSMLDDRSVSIHASGVQPYKTNFTPSRFFKCSCHGCLGFDIMASTALDCILAGGPGSGCNPEAGVCGPHAKPKTDKELDESLNKKFGGYEKMVKAVGDRKITGLAVFGERGIGKSKTVIDTLKDAKDVTLTKIKGTISPLELYNTLYQHSGTNDIVWFDDCDSAFESDISLNILKAVLDTDEPREVGWKSTSSKVEVPEFQFKGRVIITTNIKLSSDEHTDAMLDRMHWVNLKLTPEEKMRRIEQIAPKMLSNLDDKTVKDVVGWIKKNQKEIGDKLSLRTVKKVGDLATIDSDWKELASTMVKGAPKEEEESKPQKRGKVANEEDSNVHGPKISVKYDAIAVNSGYKKTDAGTYQHKNGSTLTMDGRNWKVTTKAGKPTVGIGSNQLKKHMLKTT